MLSTVICPDLVLDLFSGLEPSTYETSNLDLHRSNISYLKSLVDENKITIYLHPTLQFYVRMAVENSLLTPEQVRQAMNRLSDYISVDTNFSLDKSSNEANDLFAPKEAEYSESLILVSAKLIEADAIICTTENKKILNEICKLNPKYFRGVNIPIFSLESFIDYCQSENSLLSKPTAIQSIITTTPRGAVISLPRNSTPIDFAYKLHSKMANSCVQAFVNGEAEPYPLDQPLQNGDMVEIKKGHRNELIKVLNLQSCSYQDFDNVVQKIAQTAFARKQLKKCLEQAYQELGREILLKDLSKEQRKKIKDLFPIKNLLPNKDIKSENELVLCLGLKKINVDDIYKKILDLRERDDTKFFFAPYNKDLFRERKYEIATCCCPSIYQSITGVISSLKKPIRVHRKNCVNLQKICDDNLIDLEWQCDALGLDLQLHLHNKPRTLLPILNTLEQDYGLRLNIHSVHPVNDSKISSVTIKVLVKEVHDLSVVLERLQDMNGVLSIRVKYLKPLDNEDALNFL